MICDFQIKEVPDTNVPQAERTQIQVSLEHYLVQGTDEKYLLLKTVIISCDVEVNNESCSFI